MKFPFARDITGNARGSSSPPSSCVSSSSNIIEDQTSASSSSPECHQKLPPEEAHHLEEYTESSKHIDSQFNVSNGSTPESLLAGSFVSVQGGDDDDISGITKDDEASVVSKVRTIVQESLQLLRGEPLSNVAEEEEDELESPTEDKRESFVFPTGGGGDEHSASDNFFESIVDDTSEGAVITTPMLSLNRKKSSVSFHPQISSIISEDDPPKSLPKIHSCGGPPSLTNQTSSEDTGLIGRAIRMTIFLGDSPSEMTYSRRIALFLMKRYKWYNPRLGEDFSGDIDDENDKGGEKPQLSNFRTLSLEQVNDPGGRKKPQSNQDIEDNSEGQQTSAVPSWKRTDDVPPPSLDKAWAFFEHVTLSRYVVDDRVRENKGGLLAKIFCKGCMGKKAKLTRAKPGEWDLPTRLYSPLFTPLRQMGDFGLGIGLYFSTLRAISVLTFLAGLISTFNIAYFAGPEYSDGQKELDLSGTQGSAICTRQMWVPCPSCSARNFRFANERIVSGTSVAGKTMTFALKNNCDIDFAVGMVNYGALWFMVFGVVALNYYLERRSIQYDEDEQTAQDYSIRISNPPPDSKDPDEWRDFFADGFGAHTTVVTLAIDNDLLLQSLTDRRIILNSLSMLCPGESLDVRNLARLSAEVLSRRKWYDRLVALISPGIPERFGKLIVLNGRIQGLTQLDYPVTNVFVTFETESMQRKVLADLSIDNRLGSLANVPTEKLFRRKKLLNVSEADEPSTVRWKDLNAKFKARFIQLAMTTISTIAAILCLALLIMLIRDKKGPWWASIAVSIFNAIFPLFAKFLTNLEQHTSEGKKQTSLYIKIAAFRWVNTAVVTAIISPFTHTIEKGELIASIYAIFIADIVTSNGIQLLDISGHLNRHVLAPRASSQEAMNMYMMGTQFELAERYTNMSKILFLTFWYCSIFPAAFYLCAIAMSIIFFVDKFSLMRQWARAPMLGPHISRFNRRYVTTFSVVVLAVVSSHYWSGFPFDNLCVAGSCETSGICGMEWKISSQDDNNVDVSNIYKFCSQNIAVSHNGFPFIPLFQPEEEKWMSHDQESITLIFGWTSVIITAIVVVYFSWFSTRFILGKNQRFSTTRGKDQGISFSEVASMSTYIPQVITPASVYPLVAIDTQAVDEELYDWSDPEKDYGQYDLTKDANELLGGRKELSLDLSNAFSCLKHYPPN